MINVFSGDINSMFIAILVTGVLSFFNPRLFSLFPRKIGYEGNYIEHNIMNSLLYSLFISIGLMIIIFILGITSITLPQAAKWIYLSFCIVLMREGMQMSGIMEHNSLFSIASGNKKGFKNALLIGILAGFLFFPVVVSVYNKIFVFIAGTKILGIVFFVIYAIGQGILLLFLELLVLVMQNTSLFLSPKNAKNHNKLIKNFLGGILILMGFIMSYFGFSYDFH